MRNQQVRGLSGGLRSTCPGNFVVRPHGNEMETVPMQGQCPCMPINGFEQCNCPPLCCVYAAMCRICTKQIREVR